MPTAWAFAESIHDEDQAELDPHQENTQLPAAKSKNSSPASEPISLAIQVLEGASIPTSDHRRPAHQICRRDCLKVIRRSHFRHGTNGRLNVRVLVPERTWRNSSTSLPTGKVCDEPTAAARQA
jgi:hypothetical protein